MQSNSGIIAKYANGNLVLQIFVGIILGVVVAMVSKDLAMSFSILGTLFVGALKAIAPILVFVLVATAIATKEVGVQTGMKPIVILYLIGTFLAALIAVLASYFFPVELVLIEASQKALTPPDSVIDVLKTVLFNMVDNPVKCLTNR
jgi:serine/threonine transporter